MRPEPCHLGLELGDGRVLVVLDGDLSPGEQLPLYTGNGPRGNSRGVRGFPRHEAGERRRQDSRIFRWSERMSFGLSKPRPP